MLGRSRAQRDEKQGVAGSGTLEDEFADVIICVIVLADTVGVEVGGALRAKMATVDARRARTGTG